MSEQGTTITVGYSDTMKMKYHSLSFIFLLYGIVHSEYKSYDGYKVLRVNLQNHAEWLSLEKAEETFQLDFWKQPPGSGDQAVVMVSPEFLNDFIQYMENNNLHFTVSIDDVQRAIDNQHTGKSHDQYSDRRNDIDPTQYHNLTEITDWLETMPAFCTYENDSCHVMGMGASYEGYPLSVMHIGRTTENRRGIWLDCGIHAREWISPAVCNYIIGRLILDVETDPEVAALREMFDFFVESVVNPDGYDYTWTTDRMWRKTRSPNENSECIGTDGNRNFPFEWGGDGASTDPCSEVYRGSEASSELEVTAVTDFITDTGMVTGFDMLVTLHSFGKILLYPWAYTDAEDPEDIDDLIAAADVMVTAMNSVHDQGYIHGQPGVHSGSTMDWAKGAAGIKYSYLLELRDDGEFGFLLPEDQIEPCAEEVWEGLKAMLFHMAEN